MCLTAHSTHRASDKQIYVFILTYNDMGGRIFLKTDPTMYTCVHVYADVTTLQRLPSQLDLPAVHDRNANDHNEMTCHFKEENVKVIPLFDSG